MDSCVLFLGSIQEEFRVKICRQSLFLSDQFKSFSLQGIIEDSRITCENCIDKIEIGKFVDYVRVCLLLLKYDVNFKILVKKEIVERKEDGSVEEGIEELLYSNKDLENEFKEMFVDENVEVKVKLEVDDGDECIKEDDNKEDKIDFFCLVKNDDDCRECKKLDIIDLNYGSGDENKE